VLCPQGHIPGQTSAGQYFTASRQDGKPGQAINYPRRRRAPGRKALSRNELPTTDTELSAMAAAVNFLFFGRA